MTSTGSFYAGRCYLPPMTAGRSINSCKSALYVLLFFSPLCVLRAHRKAVRPASSLSIHGDRIYPLQANPLVVSPPLSLHVFIELRRRRFANNYWSRYGSLLVWGSNHYSFAHETTIGLPMDDYWFGYKRLLVYRSKDYSASLPSVASSISTGGMFLRAVSHHASHRLEG